MSKKKNIILWTVSAIIMLLVVFYQRISGPTYPIKDKINISGVDIKYTLPRSHAGETDEIIKIYAPIKDIKGLITYKRFKSFDTAKTEIMQRIGDTLFAKLPHQPKAGKIEYDISLVSADSHLHKLYKEPVVIRFRGDVPAYILIPHIICMFAAFLLAARALLEAYYKGKNTYNLTKWATIVMFIGGLILGPLVQYFAFDAFWTGWPFGHDLTDNKTIVSFIVWLVALIFLKKNRENFKWVIIAFFIMLAVYAIPHSVLGSEIDHTKTQQLYERQ